MRKDRRLRRLIKVVSSKEKLGFPSKENLGFPYEPFLFIVIVWRGNLGFPTHIFLFLSMFV